MLEITPHSTHAIRSAVAQNYAPAVGGRQPRITPEPAPEDSRELSAAAREYDPRATAGEAERARIADLRAQIAADTYLTDEKLDYVVDRLYEELHGTPAAQAAGAG